MEWIKLEGVNKYDAEKYKLYSKQYNKALGYLYIIKEGNCFFTTNKRYYLNGKIIEELQEEALQIILREMEEKLDRYGEIIEETQSKYNKMCKKIKDCGFELKDKYREYNHLYDMYVDEFNDATEEDIEKWRKENE